MEQTGRKEPNNAEGEEYAAREIYNSRQISMTICKRKEIVAEEMQIISIVDTLLVTDKLGKTYTVLTVAMLRLGSCYVTDPTNRGKMK